MRIFSGIQPTGDKTLGNYIGGFRQYARTQEEGDGFFCIVDLHSITVDYEPRDLHDRTLDLYAMLVRDRPRPAAIDDLRAEPCPGARRGEWLLVVRHSYGQLGRMTQFKEKADQREFVSAGLFTYPMLMAGDILLYQTDIVPVGDDQRQHIELARDIAERFNARFGETFVVPKGVFPKVGGGSWISRSRRTGCRRRAAPHRARSRSSTSPTSSRRSSRAAVTDSGSRDLPRRGQAGDHESDRDPLGCDRPHARGDRECLRRRRLRAVQDRCRRRSHRDVRSCARALRDTPRRRATRCSTGSARARRRRRRWQHRRSRRCTSAWVSFASGARPGRSAPCSSAAAARPPRARDCARLPA